MNIQLYTGELLRLPPELAQQLRPLRNQEPLIKAIEQYLNRAHQRRMVMQRDADGNPLKPRKVQQWNGQPKPRLMFAKLGQGFESEARGSRAKVGFTSRFSTLARWHNEGKKGNDRQERPRRVFLGIGAADRYEINKLIQRYLSR